MEFLDRLRDIGCRPDDTDVCDYIRGFIDAKEYRSPEDLMEFLRPLCLPDLDEDDITSDPVVHLTTLCRQFLNLDVQHSTVNGVNGNGDEEDAPRVLDRVVKLADTEIVSSGRKVDITHHSSSGRQTISHVDQKKLEKAEEKLRVKQMNRKLKEQGISQSVEDIYYVDPKKDDQDLHTRNTMMDPTLARGKLKDIRLENFDISYGGKRILTNADLVLTFGRRYGLCGRNGVGKTSLLRAIAHRDISCAGAKAVGIPDYLRILHVEQEVSGDDTTVMQSVLESDGYRVYLMKREKSIQQELCQFEKCPVPVGMSKNEAVARREQLAQELKDIYSKLEFIEADKAEARAAIILSGLGFTPDKHQLPTKTFSGGWRMRLALARALFCKPDCLLVDEPTNHLDMPAVIWLERYLVTWPNTLVVVSHDREFLNEVATDILHMHNERLDAYRGNYNQFLSTREERRKNQQKEYESQLQYRQHLQAFIDRWRYNAKRAAQAQSKIKILEKLPELKPLEDDGLEDGLLSFKWPNPEDALSPPILQADGVSFSYTPEGPLILENVSFSVALDSRVAIVGANGSGKSSMLQLLIGNLQPTKGIVQRHGRLRIAYFSQHHVDALDGDETVRKCNAVEFLASKFPGHNEEEYRSMLGRFGLSGLTPLQPIQTLSGGQKSRVVFAMMALQNPHVLVLDEITNHLDIMTIDSLTKALHPRHGFQGGVILVSHDERFINAVCNELWVCSKGKITKFVPEANATIVGGTSGFDGEVYGSCGITEYKKRLLKDIE